MRLGQRFPAPVYLCIKAGEINWAVTSSMTTYFQKYIFPEIGHKLLASAAFIFKKVKLSLMLNKIKITYKHTWFCRSALLKCLYHTKNYTEGQQYSWKLPQELTKGSESRHLNWTVINMNFLVISNRYNFGPTSIVFHSPNLILVVKESVNTGSRSSIPNFYAFIRWTERKIVLINV